MASELAVKEMRDRLRYFDVAVTVEALKQTLRKLKVDRGPHTPGRKGTGGAALYPIEVLWVVATAYHDVSAPKREMVDVAALLDSFEKEALQSRGARRPLLVDHLEPDASQDPSYRMAAYRRLIVDPDRGLDPRVVVRAASSHGSELGLDDLSIQTLLTGYLRSVLVQLGVNREVSESVELAGHRQARNQQPWKLVRESAKAEAAQLKREARKQTPGREK